MRNLSLLLFLLLTSQDAGAQAQGAIPWYHRDRSWSISEENDAFASSDSSYTQGVRLLLSYNYWNPNWRTPLSVASFAWIVPSLRRQFESVKGSCNPRRSNVNRACGSFDFGIGQTMYTPSSLLVSTVDYRQRPYAGYLFGNFGLASEFERTQVSSELFVGILGPSSQAQEAQSLAHWTWSSGSPRPQGWSNQLPNMPQVTLVNNYATRARWSEWCIKANPCNGGYSEGRLADATLTAETVFGTLMTRASGGATVRVGYRFPDMLNADRVPTTRGGGLVGEGSLFARLIELQPWFAAFGKIDGRIVGHNSFLSGGLLDRSSTSWHGLKEIETEHQVLETSYGIAIGSDYLTATWQRVKRSREYFPNGGPHEFGGFTLSVHSVYATRH